MESKLLDRDFTGGGLPEGKQQFSIEFVLYSEKRTVCPCKHALFFEWKNLIVKALENQVLESDRIEIKTGNLFFTAHIVIMNIYFFFVA